MMLPMADQTFQLMEDVAKRFRDEYQRQSDDLGIDKPLTNAKMQECHINHSTTKACECVLAVVDKIWLLIG